MSVATHASPLSQAPSEEPPVPDLGELSDHELVEAMMAARRSASRVQAVELAAVAELARRRFAEAAGRDFGGVVEVVSPADYVYDEVAAALRLTSAAADGLIRFATELTERLPGTFAALAAGHIDYLKARTIWLAIDQVDDRVAHAIETKVLPKAPEQTSGQIRAKIRRLIRQQDPEAADRRRTEAEKHRGVELIETPDGTAQLSGVDLPADAAGAAYGRVAAIATGLKRDGDGRGIDQLRADVFLGLLRGTFTTSQPPADTTDRPTPPTPDPGWTAADDAIADTIAEAARTQLTTLTHTPNTTHHHNHAINTTRHHNHAPNDTRHNRRSERHDDIGDLIAEAATRIKRSLTDLKAGWCLPAPSPGAIPRIAVHTTPATVPDTVPTTAPDTVPDTVPTTAPDTVPTTAPDPIPDTVSTTAPDTVPTTLGAVPRTAANTTANAVPTTMPDAAPGAVPGGDRAPAATTPTEDGTTPTDNASPTEDGASPAENGTSPTQDGTSPTEDGTGPTENASPAEDGASPAENGPTPTDNASPTEDGASPAEDGTSATASAATRPETPGEDRATHGVPRYRPPAALRRLIEQRDRRCCFPGCRRPARHCDTDHTVPYHHGGATCPCNLALLCRRHHREKATTGWRIEHLWPGVICWITPTGHWRITAPADRE